MGFRFAYKLSGGAPTILDLPLAANTITVVGSLVNLESGYLDEAASADTGLVGVALEAQVNTGGSAGDKYAKCIVDPDAVYAVTDANARLAGATLDITGANAVTTSSNTDVIVVAPSAATEDTLVMIIRTSHFLGAAV